MEQLTMGKVNLIRNWWLRAVVEAINDGAPFSTLGDYDVRRAQRSQMPRSFR